MARNWRPVTAANDITGEPVTRHVAFGGVPPTDPGAGAPPPAPGGSGEPKTLRACPFCGSGNITGNSDNTTTCGFCQERFQVRIEAPHPFMPTALDGVPGPEIATTNGPVDEAQATDIAAQGQPGAPGMGDPADPAAFDQPAGGSIEDHRTDKPAQPGATLEQFRVAKVASTTEPVILRSLVHFGSPLVTVEPYRATDPWGNEYEIDEFNCDSDNIRWIYISGFKILKSGQPGGRRLSAISNIPVPANVKAALEELVESGKTGAKRYYLTGDGMLPADEYVRHIAIRFADDKGAVIDKVREEHMARSGARSAGPGSPIFFVCPQARKERRYPDLHYPDGHEKVTRTGRTKPRPPGGAIGQRQLHTSHEYRCECGHTGWSTHSGIMRYPVASDG